VDNAFARGQADLIKILSAIKACDMAVIVDLEGIETFQPEIIVERGYGTCLAFFHNAKL
jgi:hypothetical protein